jgi:predicted ATPase with chaperone activity
MALSARGVSRCIGVARTIACLAGSDQTEQAHVSEALQYRVPGGDRATSSNNADEERARAV